MKHKTKFSRWMPSAFAGLGVAALLLASAPQSQADILVTNVINTFDVAPDSGNGIGNEWGSGSWAWDSTGGNPGGAAEFTVSWDPTSDTQIVGFTCTPNGNPWYVGTPLKFSQYKTLEFDIKYDPTSDITIDEFNNPSTWPTDLTNAASGGLSVFQSWATAATLVAGGCINGLEINLCGGPAGQLGPVIINTNMPSAASNGWVHMIIPINQAQANIDNVSGIAIHRWCPQTWALVTNVTARYWIDNLMLIGTTAPPPPPTMTGPTRPVQGLNVFNSTMGNSYYDRQEVLFRTNTALSWIGRATAGNPVTYSYNIVGYPNSPDCEAYIFLSPNGGGNASPDWNDTNCAIVEIQGTTTNATMTFKYKVNEPNQQQMYDGGADYTNAPGSWDGVTPNYLESGHLGNVTNNTVLGNWRVQFTSDTNITLIAPNGNTTSLVMPPYNAGLFADNINFNVYFGGQANQANAMNQAVVYGSVGITGVPNGYTDNFLADSSLDTNAWNNSISGGPAGVFVVNHDTAATGYWVTHTLPDGGFSLQAGSSLTNMISWDSPSLGPVVPMSGVTRQLVQGSEMPAGNTAFFNMISRTATQLQVLLPGQTNAPNTALGYVGTPTPISVSGQGLTTTTITVNACDATWHIVGGTVDSVTISTSDTGAYLPPSAANPINMINGTATWSDPNGILFQSVGTTPTVTAVDNTDTNIVTGVSAPVTINP